MNLFYLDENVDQCAKYHIDKHVGKIQLEAAQLLTTAIWVDKHIGFAPRKLTKEELKVLSDAKQTTPPINERIFTRYLPTHPNHPSAIWVRASSEHFLWTINYVEALNTESAWRGNKSHASFQEVIRLPYPVQLLDRGFEPPTQAMPEEFKQANTVEAYRAYYKGAKASIASWKHRGQPDWWI